MNQNKTYNILCAAENPGGFQAIFPIIKNLREKHNGKLFFLFSGSAADMAVEQGIDFLECKKDNSHIADWFRAHPVDILLTGTSSGMSIEKYCIAEAKKKGIPSISVVDFWTNYAMRFSTPESHDLVYIPDLICAVDEKMKEDMITEKIPESAIAVTGNPYFETFQQSKKTRIDNYIVFISQPFSEIYTQKDPSLTTLVFDEVRIFADMIHALEEEQFDGVVYIGLHPRTKQKNKFNTIMCNTSLSIEILDVSTETKIPNARAVIGMNSVLLFQAALMGLPVISYQPGGNQKEDPLPSNAWGLSHGVYDRDALKRYIQQVLHHGSLYTNENEDIRNTYVASHATQHIITLMYSLLRV